MNKTFIEKKLEKLWDEYEKGVIELAAQVKKENLDKFTTKHNLSFQAGNGDWWLLPKDFFPDNRRYRYHLAFKDLDCGETVEGFTPPDDRDKIVEILELEITGIPTDSLGTYMESD